MQLKYVVKEELQQVLESAPNNSLDFIVFSVGALITEKDITIDVLKKYFVHCIRVLKKGGLLFVQGQPDYLPELGVYLDQHLQFKYWIAIESEIHQPTNGLPSSHADIILYSNGKSRFNVAKTRFAHQICSHCGKPLKDWGGKTHLMHPEGYVISDVWKDLEKGDNYSQISSPVLDTILRLVDFRPSKKENNIPDESIWEINSSIKGLVVPKEGVSLFSDAISEKKTQYELPGFQKKNRRKPVSPIPVNGRYLNVVHQGDLLETLKQYPDESIDLVFADPPYNLEKNYTSYKDGIEDESYITWCNSWLTEYVRVLKPSGSLFVLNLPRWTMYHADFLNRYMHFQNWIVWDALSEPRGKLMPAHYGLLFFTKEATSFTFNYNEMDRIDARYYCLRKSCIRKRKDEGEDDKQLLTDIWWDIHRIKHKRDRDYHPCQLPDKLMERIIKLTTNEGDVVLDGLAGAGTTPVIAQKLGRQYVAIDLDKYYVNLMRDKLKEFSTNGIIRRQSIKRARKKYTKKELQLELRDLASKLGRLPKPEDVAEFSKYEIDIFYELFPTWGKALKAAKLEINSE